MSPETQFHNIELNHCLKSVIVSGMNKNIEKQEILQLRYTQTKLWATLNGF